MEARKKACQLKIKCPTQAELVGIDIDDTGLTDEFSVREVRLGLKVVLNPLACKNALRVTRARDSQVCKLEAGRRGDTPVRCVTINAGRPCAIYRNHSMSYGVTVFTSQI